MKKWLWIFLLAAPLGAQINPTLVPVPTTANLPATCSGNQAWLVTFTTPPTLLGNIYTCQAGVPTLYANGGGGGVSSFNTRTGAVTLTAADVNGVGAITNSTTGNAATATALAGASALPNGTTATTQSTGDNSTDLATDAFVQSANPMTTLGDLIYGGASGVATRLAGNTLAGTYFLGETATGSSVAPVWVTYGTAALVNTGTSGATVPLLNGANAYSASQSATGSAQWLIPSSNTGPGFAETGNLTTGIGLNSTNEIDFWLAGFKAGYVGSQGVYTVKQFVGAAYTSAQTLIYADATDNTATLSANATPTLSTVTQYSTVTLAITQNSTGGYTFTYPANMTGGGAVNTLASTSSYQLFHSFDGTHLVAVSPMYGSNGGILPIATRKGTFVCTSGGAIPVNNANYLITSDVIITTNTPGGTQTYAPNITAQSTGVSFTVTCASLDTSTYNYYIVN